MAYAAPDDNADDRYDDNEQKSESQYKTDDQFNVDWCHVMYARTLIHGVTDHQL